MLEGQKNFIVIDLNTICDINSLVVWLHAVHKVARRSYDALKQAIGRGQKDDLRFTFCMHGLNLDAPDVINLANRSINDLAALISNVGNSDDAIVVTAHQELVQNQL